MHTTKITRLGSILTLFLVGTLFWSCSSNRPASARVADGKVNTGYTYQNKRDFTGSAVSTDNPTGNLDLAIHLQKMAGITVRGQGANAKISIRGSEASSFSLPTDPLFVVNGNAVGTDFTSIYQMVNVNDIKKITVLKDGSSTSVYGSRGANGVILIDLK